MTTFDNQESNFSVPSSKLLFDLLDEYQTGAVPLRKIQEKWRNESVPNLPGVLECLKELSPPDRMITFEVFDWSLRVALSRVKRRRNEERIAMIELKKRELTRGYAEFTNKYGETARCYQHKVAKNYGEVNRSYQRGGSHDVLDVRSKGVNYFDDQRTYNRQQSKSSLKVSPVSDERAMNLNRLKQENDLMLQKLSREKREDEEIKVPKLRRRRTKSGSEITSRIIATLKRATSRKGDRQKNQEEKSPSKETYQEKTPSSGSSSGRGSITPPPMTSSSADNSEIFSATNPNSGDYPSTFKTFGKKESNRLFVEVGSPVTKPISLDGNTYIGVTAPRSETLHRRNKTYERKKFSQEESDSSQEHCNARLRRQKSDLTSSTNDIYKKNRRCETIDRRWRPQSVDPYDASDKGTTSESDCKRDSVAAQKRSRNERSRNNPRRHTLSHNIDVEKLAEARKLQEESQTLEEAMEEMREAVDRLKRRQKQVDAQVRHLTDNLNNKDDNVVHASQEQIEALRRTTCEMTNVSRALLYPNANEEFCVDRNAGYTNKEKILREQNKQLKEILSEKSIKLKALNDEKIILIKQLFKNQPEKADKNESSMFI